MTAQCMSISQELVQESRVDILENRISILKKQNEQFRVAYLSLVELHAILMLDTLTRQGIEYELDLVYPFNAGDEVTADVRAALNAEQADRNRYNRFKKVSA